MPSTEALTVVPMKDRIDMAIVDELAMPLVEQWAQPRRHWLKKREAALAYVRDTRKKILGGIAKPMHMLVAGSLADIDDGAPFHVVARWLYSLIDLLRDRAYARDLARGKSWEQRFVALCTREADAEGALDKAAILVAANPRDRRAILAKQEASRTYRIVLDEMDAMLAERLREMPEDRAA